MNRFLVLTKGVSLFQPTNKHRQSCLVSSVLWRVTFPLSHLSLSHWFVPTEVTPLTVFALFTEIVLPLLSVISPLLSCQIVYLVYWQFGKLLCHSNNIIQAEANFQVKNVSLWFMLVLFVIKISKLLVMHTLMLLDYLLSLKLKL